jgi:branched-chain amino acid transport system substrate-binding protein
VLSEDCTGLIPAKATLTDSTVLIGYTAPFTSSDPADPPGARAGANMIELALGEFSRAVTGLPPILGGSRRPVVAVRCDDSAAPDRMFTHLVDDLDVPVIIGNSYSSTVLQVAPTIVIPGHTFFMVPLSGSPSISTMDDNNLVWRTIGSSTDFAEPMARVVDLLEARVRNQLSLGVQPVRVALLVNRGTLYSLVAEKLENFLRFNGLSLGENLAAQTFLRTDYDDPSDNPNVDYSTTAASVVDFNPHIVIVIGGPETNGSVIPTIESAHRSGTFPYEYLIGDGAYDSSAVTAYGMNDDLRHRVVGVSGAVDLRTVPTFDAFKIRYNASYKDPVETSDGLEAIYDGLYATLYAMVAAAPGKPVTGPGIAAGMASLDPGGTPVTVGPTDWATAFSTLSSGGKLLATGVVSTLLFNSSGDIPTAPAVYCVVRANGTGIPTLEVENTGVAWNPTTAVFDGAINCP